MASTVVSIRVPAAILRLVDAAAAARGGLSRSDVILDTLADGLGGHKAEPPPAPPPKPPRMPAAAKPPGSNEAARAALSSAESRVGVAPAGAGRGAAAMEAAGVMVYRGEKRPAYQKTGGPKGGKARGR